MRDSDYERTPGRVMTGWDGELSLDRTPVNDDIAYVSDDDDNGLGYSSANLRSAGIALASAEYVKSKTQWQDTPDWERQRIYEQRKVKRANRDWQRVREDSIHRHRLKWLNRFIEDREEGWEFLDSEEIDQMNGIDFRSADQIAQRWKQKDDETKLASLVVKYAAMLEGATPRTIQARFRRKPHEKELAEVVYVLDALATGVVMPSGFDADQLSMTGDELAIHMQTNATEQERRAHIIEGARAFYAQGSLYPPYVLKAIDPMLAAVADLLVEAGLDFSDAEEEIDWSEV